MKHKKLNELLGVTIVNDMQGIWYAYQPNDNYNTSINEIIKLKEQNLFGCGKTPNEAYNNLKSKYKYSDTEEHVFNDTK